MIDGGARNEEKRKKTSGSRSLPLKSPSPTEPIPGSGIWPSGAPADE